MDESGEDLISNLPESVVCHILSRLPTKDVVRTSLLSKDWKHKCAWIYNIELDDTNRNKSLSWKTKRKNFVTLVERTLHLTRNLRIKSFRLTCHRAVSSLHLETWMRADLISDVQNLEINVRRCWGKVVLGDIFHKCRSTTELKLFFNCKLVISLVKNRFSNLKILYLGYAVELWDHKVPESGKLVLNFPILEELELRCCKWRGGKFVEINAPALTRFLVEGQREHFLNDYPIKIDGAKLEKFESCGGLLDNYFVRAPSVSNAVFTNCKGGVTVGFRARAMLRGFAALECLKLSSEIVKVLTQSEADLSLLCFNRLKQLEISNHIGNELLLKLLQVMPSLELLSLYVYKDYKELESLPSGIASRLKIVKLVGFGGTTGQIQLAKSILNNVENLEMLFVSVCYKPVMSKIEIRHLLSTIPRHSTRATVVVNGPRKRDTNLER